MRAVPKTTEPMRNNPNEIIPPNALEKLAYTGKEFDSLTGLSPVTRWRLERRGLLKSVPGIRHKLYSRAAVMRFLDGEGSLT